MHNHPQLLGKYWPPLNYVVIYVITNANKPADVCLPPARTPSIVAAADVTTVRPLASKRVVSDCNRCNGETVALTAEL